VLRDGGDPDTIDITGQTVLEIAVHLNYRDDVKVLLDRGADPNLCGLNNRCPLFMAIDADTEILRLLLAAGAGANWEDEQTGSSVLTWVSGQAVGRFFIGKSGLAFRYRHGAFPDPVESARILIAAGADVNHVGRSGRSPLRSAMRANNLDIAKLLLESGADVRHRVDGTAWGEQERNTVLMQTVGKYAVNRDTRAVKLLLDHGADPNDANNLPYDAACDGTTEGKCTWRGYTALTFAASRGWSEVVRMLLEYGADPAIPRGDGKTALELAEAQGHAGTARLLREHRTAAPQ
jgi:ankyrin repeat protein